jgi:hypothetical protein
MLWVLLCALFIYLPIPTLFAQDAALPAEATAEGMPEPGEAEEAGDPGEAEEDLGPISIEIDLDRLLFDNRGGSVQDPVWRLQPAPGKKILLLPFTVDNVHRINKLSRFPVSVRAGRFIGFVIPKTESNTRGADEGDLNEIIRAAPEELQELLFASAQEEGGVELEPVDSPDVDVVEPMPESAPRLAREITLHPDGTVHWEMDRKIHGAELQSAGDNNPYAYKINPQYLRDAQPERAERLTRNDNEDAREYAQRKREHQLAEREKQEVYRELRDDLRKLPERFSEPMPDLLYAAIEVADDDTLTLEGQSPYPWSVDAEKKQLLDDLSRSANAFQEAGGKQLAASLVTMIDSHPLDARAIAYAARRGRLVSQVQVDGPGYLVLTRLLQSNDIPARRIALYSVATANPPSLASAKLIGVAGEAAMGEERKMLSFESLGKLFSTQADDPENARVLIDRVSKTIADPQGPAAPSVIERVLTTLSPSQDRYRGQTAQSETTSVMVEALDLAGLTENEYDGVARAIIRHAPHSPVAAGWLDQKLLASSNQDLVNITLIQLYESKIIRPTNDQSPEEGTPEPVLDADTIVLTDTIPMTRADHALLTLFDAEDDVQKAAAWAVLGRFHLALPKALDGATPVAPAPGADAANAIDPTVALFNSILKKAGQLEQIPASIVAFLVNQKDPALATIANTRFVALLTEEDLAQKTSLPATQTFIATPDRFTQIIGALEPVDQMKVMETLYGSQNEKAPLMAGLIADRGQTMNWLISFVKDNGTLPTKADWVKQAQSMGENTLIQSASSEDVTLATAGATALVAAAGGDEQQEQAFAQKVIFMEARERQLVQAEWDKQRAKIFASAFKRAAGTYELVVTLVDRPTQTGFAPDAEADTRKEKRIDLGVVELQVEGVELSLSSESIQVSSMTDKLGIRLENPESLRSFSKPELTAIPSDHLKGGIDLLPNEEGHWVGETPLRDGRTFRVSLEPAS